jgi:hypothetical protein
MHRSCLAKDELACSELKSETPCALTTVSVHRAAHQVLVICMLLWGACVETLVLAPPPVAGSGSRVMPAPGLRAVWNDLTPLVFSAMQRSGAAPRACPRANAGAGG